MAGVLGMTDRSKIRDLLGRLYKARMGGKPEEVAELFSTDADFAILGAGQRYPVSITAKGRAEIRTTIALLSRISKLRHYDLISLIVDGDDAAIQWRATVHSKLAARPCFTEFVDIVKVSDNHIQCYTELFAPHAVPAGPATVRALNAIKF